MKKLIVILTAFLFGVPAYGTDDLVAAVLVMEARGDGVEGMSAVMSVIHNRAKHDPRNWRAVVRKPRQFAVLNHVINGPMSTERFIEVARSKMGWEEAKRIVKLCREGFLLDVTGGADHYHSEYVKPYWADADKMTIKLRHHIFYKL